MHVSVDVFFEGTIRRSHFSGSLTAKATYGTTCTTHLNYPQTLRILRMLKTPEFLKHCYFSTLYGSLAAFSGVGLENCQY